ncbi:hypothetical protein N1F89_04510 [Aquibium sp. A9E412]|uniref:hypothetical protein n=1 Tax=Aquibium sp. A9E412 TaxID=2976767 RepID=UPI0025B1C0A5|nr:hypothetical protein [Aquibium sp. A9E412]MDN2565475.1 hypothetical protein [Aquibium sp. A9E412]
MRQPSTNCIKRRLTERRHIATAIDHLTARGVPRDGIDVVLSRLFFVDVDLLNEVLESGDAWAAPGASGATMRIAAE